MKRRSLNELSEDLDMLASQLRESLDGDGSRPSPWRLDDWMTEYRQAYGRGWRAVTASATHPKTE